MATERFALTDRAIRIIAEDKIQSAIRAGEFDNLSGLGEPFDWCDEPYDPNWWVRRKLRDENLTSRCVDRQQDLRQAALPRTSQ
jgi:hypothetical protein